MQRAVGRGHPVVVLVAPVAAHLRALLEAVERNAARLRTWQEEIPEEPAPITQTFCPARSALTRGNLTTVTCASRSNLCRFRRYKVQGSGFSPQGDLRMRRASRILPAAIILTLVSGAGAIPLPPAEAAQTCAGHRATIVGTPGPDRIVGKRASDVIAGLAATTSSGTVPTATTSSAATAGVTGWSPATATTGSTAGAATISRSAGRGTTASRGAAIATSCSAARVTTASAAAPAATESAGSPATT